MSINDDERDIDDVESLGETKTGSSLNGDDQYVAASPVPSTSSSGSKEANTHRKPNNYYDRTSVYT